MCEIYMKPAKELFPKHILQLMKTLYGLADSGDRWYFTLKEHHLKDIKMLPSDGDLILYSSHTGDRLIGLSGVYVDDTLQAGDRDFQEWTRRTSEKFDATPRQSWKGKFAGMDFGQSNYLSRVRFSMQRYIGNKLKISASRRAPS